MKKYYDLSHLDSCIDDFEYVYSPLSKTHHKFKQDKGYISNFRNEEFVKNSAEGVDVPDYFYGVNPDKFAWIGLLSKEKYTAGTKVTFTAFMTISAARLFRLAIPTPQMKTETTSSGFILRSFRGRTGLISGR